MKRLVAVVAVLLFVAGCGSSSKADSAKVKNLDLTQKQLDAAMLTAADAPSGYEVASGSGEHSDDTSTGCAHLDAVKFTLTDGSPSQIINLAPPSNNTGLTESVAIENKGKAKKIFDDVAQASAKCATFTVHGQDGTKSDFTLTPLALPKFGENTFATRMTTQTANGPVNFDIVVIQDGSAIVYVSNGGFAEPDTALTVSFVQKAINKLHTAS